MHDDMRRREGAGNAHGGHEHGRGIHTVDGEEDEMGPRELKCRENCLISCLLVVFLCFKRCSASRLAG